MPDEKNIQVLATGGSSVLVTEIDPAQKPIDVPSIMFGSGYDKGRSDERAAVLAALRTACDEAKAALARLEGQVAAIERGDHVPKT